MDEGLKTGLFLDYFLIFWTVLFLVCFLFISTFTGSRSTLCIVYMGVSLFFLVFTFFSLQLIYRRAIEFRVDFFLSSQKIIDY